MFTDIATIDGPPASGKTTMAYLLAKSFDLTHLDSGAIFRSITLNCIEKGVDLTRPQDVIRELPSVDLSLFQEKTFLNGHDISKKIRSPLITNNVCHISNIPEIRKFVMDFQLSYSKSGKIVCDGRKVGTEVFPDAKVKFFLTADLEVRAIRRYKQLLGIDKRICFSEVHSDLKKREEYEVKNGILLMPENAIVIDNSQLTIEETLICMSSYME